MADSERFGAFVEHLERLRDSGDKGALAALRRGLGRPPGEIPEVYPHVFGVMRGMSPWEERICLLAAPLFASHPDRGGEGDMGSVFRRIQAITKSRSVENRFLAMLNCDDEELPAHLRHAVSLARSNGVPIPWRSLLKDLLFWSHESRFVQRKWATSFWSKRDGEEAGTDSEADGARGPRPGE